MKYLVYVLESMGHTRIPIKNNDFWNRNIISPLQVRGLDYCSGSEFKFSVKLIGPCPLLI